MIGDIGKLKQLELLRDSEAALKKQCKRQEDEIKALRLGRGMLQRGGGIEGRGGMNGTARVRVKGGKEGDDMPGFTL